ncbi:amidase [Alcanivorax hongdengensis A-11-3]|uniref:Amidase n=1 Tax=Alcanivorax hongdengensis A-11-3 TaxID=1177179 RepID=L0WER2_9GAMM|nr:amidase [Alcanivorax hongdengensis]EKF74295.1 amidase [Alcanivorax hongdengensis A-11-3]
MPRTVHAFTDDALAHHDATALAALIAKGEIHPREATDAALARLAAVEPQLNAMVLTDREASQARASEKTFTGFFAGVPSLIKDNIDMPGLPTRHGSAAVGGKPLKKTSVLARQYLAQGFNVIGKTRLPAFGFTASTELAHDGATHNPWHGDYSAGGSSGGSAALVAAGVVPIAHGNDGGGSIRIPAACCGLVGLKCTRGRLVTQEAGKALPVNIISDGVLTRSVRDTANFFSEAERYYRNRKLPAIGQVTGPGKGRLRIGMMIDSITGDPSCAQTRATVEATARQLAGLGHRVEEARIDLPQRFVDDFLLYWAMLAFSVSQFGRALFPQGFDRSQLDPLTLGLADYYKQRFLKTPGMIRQLKKSQQRYARTFNDYDVILSPVLAHTTPPLGYLGADVPFDTQLERLLRYTTFTPANNASGSPALSLPMGQTDQGLPIGVQFSGRHGDERTLLALGFELEQAQPLRQLYQQA